MDNFISPVELDIYLDEVPTAATGLITSDETQPDADGTITIGSHVYTFKSALTGAADEVLIETNAATTLANLVTLINDGRAAVAEGFSGNAVVFTESATHISISGSGTLGGTQAGSNTTGTSEAIGQGGRVQSITTTIPQLTGTPTITLKILDASGDVVYQVASLAENITTRTAVDIVVSPTDKIQLLASAGVENDDPVKVHLR